MNNINFLKYHFGNKTDKSNVFCWKHALSVSKTLKKYLKNNNEIPNEVKILIQAALGHDLLEDSSCSKKEITDQWGNDTLLLIEKLTNEKGDNDFEEYISNFRYFGDEILLIKLADIKTNTANSIIYKNVLGKSWFHSFWIPLIEKYLNLFTTLKFIKFPKTINNFIEDIKQDLFLIKKISK